MMEANPDMEEPEFRVAYGQRKLQVLLVRTDGNWMQKWLCKVEIFLFNLLKLDANWDIKKKMMLKREIILN